MTDERQDVRRLRARPRLRLFQPNELRRPDGSAARVHLLDLSGTGALIHSATPPAPGSTVQLSLGGAWRAGEVVWADERRFGLHFRTPLSDAEVAGVVKAREAVLAEAGRRLGVPVR